MGLNLNLGRAAGPIPPSLGSITKTFPSETSHLLLPIGGWVNLWLWLGRAAGKVNEIPTLWLPGGVYLRLGKAAGIIFPAAGAPESTFPY